MVTMIKTHSRISRENRTVQIMIGMCCADKHSARELCPACRELATYTMERLDFQEKKTTCSRCPMRCYVAPMREKIREVMRYSGPRMTFRHPILAFLHLLDEGRKVPLRDVSSHR